MSPNPPNPPHNFGSVDHTVLASRVLEELDQDKRELYDSLPQHEKDFVIESFVDIVRGDPKKLQTLWEIDFVRKPISIDEFISSEDYLGKMGKGLFPCWRKELDYLFNTDNDVNEVICTGAIGIGKTTFAVIAMAYRLYWLTCLRNPYEYFGLMEVNTSFAFGLFNATRELSYQVHVVKILEVFKSCPYFRWLTTGTLEDPKRDKDVLDFPNNIKLAFGSRGVHALGQDLIGGLLDEMNFQQETVLSADQVKSQARDMYRQTSRRIVSRFAARPGLRRKSPGLMFLVSSRKGEDDFLDAHIRERGMDKTLRVISFSTWEATGHQEGKYPSGKWFRVLVGDSRLRSKVLADEEPDPEGYRVLKVPEEHRREFTMDPDGSIMDLGGISIAGGGRPLLLRDKLYECIANDLEYWPRKHPFKSDIIKIGLRTSNFIEDDFDWQEIVQCVDNYRKIYSPKVNPAAPRYIHLDPATSGDCLYGFAMGHVAGRTKVRRYDDQTSVEVDISIPVIYIDLMLGISHPPGDEVDLAKVRSFIFFLRKIGFPIYAVTSDQYQSADTLQIFKKSGFETERISLDGKPENYSMFRDTVHEGRLLAYEYKPWVEEAIWLQVDPTTKSGARKPGKVFKLEGRSKDLSDAVAGVVAKIMTDDESEHTALLPIRSADSVVDPRRRKSIDLEGEWLLDEVVRENPHGSHITGIRR